MSSTTNQPHWLSAQEHGDDLECVSSRVSRRSVGRLATRRSLGTRSCVHAYARDGSAHTPARRTRRRSHSYARPLELHSFIKVRRERTREPHAAPRRAFGRPFTNGAYAASRRRATHTPVRDCVLMAAIAIDFHSKFKRTYFPNRGDETAGRAAIIIPSASDVRIRDRYRVRIAKERRERG